MIYNGIYLTLPLNEPPSSPAQQEVGDHNCIPLGIILAGVESCSDKEVADIFASVNTETTLRLKISTQIFSFFTVLVLAWLESSNVYPND